MVAGTMLSLFDGSGGFSLAGRMVGIEPVMASEVKPYPIAVTRSRFPKMKHLGSVTEIKGDEIEPVDVVTFGSPCFPEGTLVLTKTGYEPIENIRVGDEVFTHKGNWKPVSAVGYKHSRTVRMKGNHYGLIATPNHPFYSATQGKVWNRNGYTKTLECVGEWRPAEEMQGRRWAIPNHILGVEIPKIECTSAKGNRPPKINEDLMYVLGRYLGDGWLRDGQRPNRPAGQTWGQIFICAGHKKADFLEEQMHKVFDGNSAMYRIKERTVDKIRVSNTALCKWIKKNFGQKATGKTIPSWVFCMSESMRTALLQGYLDSDGYHVKENSWKITTVSKKLAHSVRLLGETLGYSTTVYAVDVEKTKTIEGRLIQQNAQYVASLSNEKRKTGIKDGIHTWYKCRSVEPYSEEQKVYNITVEDDHSYVVEGFVVHNCQDLSIAGTRSGLKHTDNGDDETTRSGLFYEAIRIIKEMRNATNGLYPTFAVWENVFGAFSSNKGEDFRAVLQEFIQVAEPTAIMPPVPKGGWAYADCYRGDGWSLAYRTVDAQYWGVPQRRRRIYLVADFGGQCASEILFNGKSLLWHPSESRKAWQSVAGYPAESVGTADSTVGIVPYTLKIRSGCDGGGKGALIQTNKSATLSTNNDQYLFVPVYSVENHPTDSRVKIDPNGTVQTLTSRMGTGGGNVPLILTYDARGNGDGKTVNTITGDHNNRVTDCNCVVCEPVVYNGENITSPTNKANPKEGDPCHTIGTDSRNYLVYCLQGNGIERSDAAGCCGKGWTEDTSYTLNTMDRHAVAYSQQAYDEYVEADKGSTLKARGGTYGGGSENIVVEPQYIVRRLCPVECARLQGFPTIVEVDMKDITRDEVCAIALATGHIRVNVESGKVYATRGPGGVERTSPIELKGSIVNGYKVHSLHAAGFKKQVRANRLVWIAAHGAIPEGMIVDHINNDKTDNRLANLQLLTPKANSTKAKEDGRYLTGDDHRGTKINDCGKKALCFLYWNTDKPYSYFAKMFGISDSRAQQIIHENHWGHPDHKDDFTDEEYAFWLKVRNDWATINGKKVKEYKKEQMLKWYNGLHTDSAEYEMWGNGIALPNALYVMEGIAEVLRRRKERGR